LFLINQKLKFVPIKPYASLREALKFFPEKGLSIIGAHLYDLARGYFLDNS